MPVLTHKGFWGLSAHVSCQRIPITAKNNVERILGVPEKEKIVTASRERFRSLHYGGPYAKPSEAGCVGKGGTTE